MGVSALPADCTPGTIADGAWGATMRTTVTPSDAECPAPGGGAGLVRGPAAAALPPSCSVAGLSLRWWRDIALSQTQQVCRDRAAACRTPCPAAAHLLGGASASALRVLWGTLPITDAMALPVADSFPSGPLTCGNGAWARGIALRH